LVLEELKKEEDTSVDVNGISFVWDRLVGQYLVDGVIDYLPDLDRFTIANGQGYSC
jgi:Fe-S cluster assembly iron-binding protein IscA